MDNAQGTGVFAIHSEVTVTGLRGRLLQRLALGFSDEYYDWYMRESADKPPKRPGLLELERKFKALQKPPRFRRTPSSGVDGEVWQLAGKLAGRRPAVHSGQGHYGAWTVADHAYKGYYYY